MGVATERDDLTPSYILIYTESPIPLAKKGREEFLGCAEKAETC